MRRQPGHRHHESNDWQCPLDRHPAPPLIEEAKPTSDAIELVLWGGDEGEETIRNDKYRQNFARSMTLTDLARSEAILAWEMNGEPLTPDHGFPVRVVVPGWYGVQNVKWLTGLEVSNERFMGRFQARDYVTIIGRQQGDKTEWVETSVTKMRTKSMIAKVTRRPSGGLSIFGVAITDGTPLKTVEVQLNDGQWVAAKLEAPPNPYAWTWFRATWPLQQRARTRCPRKRPTRSGEPSRPTSTRRKPTGKTTPSGSARFRFRSGSAPRDQRLAVDHERRHGVQEFAQHQRGLGIELRLIERTVHQRHPPIARGLGDGKGHVTHAQPWMPALLDVTWRTTKAAHQKITQADLRAGEVGGGIHGAQHLVTRDLRVKRAHQAGETLLAHTRIDLVLGQIHNLSLVAVKKTPVFTHRIARFNLPV